MLIKYIFQKLLFCEADIESSDTRQCVRIVTDKQRACLQAKGTLSFASKLKDLAFNFLQML